MVFAHARGAGSQRHGALQQRGVRKRQQRARAVTVLHADRNVLLALVQHPFDGVVDALGSAGHVWRRARHSVSQVLSPTP